MNKIDRLIVEMKIPPEDAYLKLKHTLEEVNSLFVEASNELGITNRYLISPVLNNVVFASGEYGFMVSVESMVEKYAMKFKGMDKSTFEKVLWGDFYYNPQNRKFSRKPPTPLSKRTFVEFILEPIYKIFAHTVGKDRDRL